ncbi:MAG: pilus assembly protein PilB [Planctomycetota bacterium]|nr:MAG: pilus assembly protein PilB [Planctomycetota bacterium]
MTEPRKQIGQILKEMELVTEGQIQEALEIQKDKGGAIGRILVDLGYVTEEEILFALGAQWDMEIVNLDDISVPPEIIEKVPPSIANIYKVVPVEMEDGALVVAMSDPLNVGLLDELKFMLDYNVKGAVSNEGAIDRALKRYYGDQVESIETVIQQLEQDEDLSQGGAIDISKIEMMGSLPPVVKLLNLILYQAIRDKASDIHFEPFENEFKIRYRIDGALYEMAPPPPHIALALISRIKVMSRLDIAETRMPQDGRVPLTIAGRPVDLRVSTLPTMHGESVVMRVLDRSVVSLDLEQLGFNEEELKMFREIIRKPNGIILVTGPTGCGKTTTLYSALQEINTPELKIITTEDPVEYDIEGIMQVEINEEIGVDFATCLRSIVRQDPDVILVGEIRDLETAEMAIDASLTGHLVFSTLHTNDAPTTVTRLIELEVPPFLISATLEAVISQRLVRKICPNCKTEFEPSDEMLYELGLSRKDVSDNRFFYGRGCMECNHTGYKGRTAIFETLLLSENIRQMIIEGASTGRVRQVAREEGMITLRERGLRLIFEGVTTIEEIVKETLQAV